MSTLFIDILLYKYSRQQQGVCMVRKSKVKTPEDIINDIKEKQSEIDDLLWDLEDTISVSSDSDISDFDEEEEIDETDEE
jgi:hypothetical protein